MYWLRFNLDLREPYLADMLWSLAWIVPLQAAIFLAFGLYRGLWRFASMVDLQRIVLSAGLGALLIPVVLVMLQLQAMVPRSVLVLYPLVLIFLMAGNRFAYRIWKEHRLYSPLAALGEPVLVVGAGEAGARLTSELARSRQWRVVGLLDDDRAKQGRHLRDVKVLGPIADLPSWAHKFGVRKVIIALPSAQPRRAPAGRRAVRGAWPRGADRALVRGPDQRPLGADDDPQRRAGRPARPRPGRARHGGPRRMARQPRRDGDRRRRVDRRRALPPHRALPSRAAGAVRRLRSGVVRDPDHAGGRVLATARRQHRRRRQAHRAGRGGASRAKSPTSSCTPPPTSTCR